MVNDITAATMSQNLIDALAALVIARDAYFAAEGGSDYAVLNAADANLTMAIEMVRRAREAEAQ